VIPLLEGTYNQIKNGIAFQALNVPPDIPDARLGVGNGETLAPLDMKIEYQPQKFYVVVPSLANASVEQTTLDGGGPPVDPSKYPNDFYFGDVIGAWQ
jgi:hypothetical protein